MLPSLKLLQAYDAQALNCCNSSKQYYEAFALPFPEFVTWIQTNTKADFSHEELKTLYQLRRCKHIEYRFQANDSYSRELLVNACQIEKWESISDYIVNILADDNSEVLLYIQPCESTIKLSGKLFVGYKIITASAEHIVLPAMLPYIFKKCPKRYTDHTARRLELDVEGEIAKYYVCSPANNHCLRDYNKILLGLLALLSHIYIKTESSQVAADIQSGQSRLTRVKDKLLFSRVIDRTPDVPCSKHSTANTKHTVSEHFRKGHIRHYSSGRTTYVSPTIVNPGSKKTTYFI